MCSTHTRAAGQYALMRVLVGLLVSCVLATACGAGDDKSSEPTPTSSAAVDSSSLELWPVDELAPVGTRTSACDSPVPGVTGEYCLSGNDPLMTGADFERGEALFDSYSNHWVVELHVRPESTAKWAGVLKSETNHQVAMVLDGKVVSAPTLNPGIPIDSPIQVSDEFSEAQANALASAFPR
jgi:preprotein translocase subunit SecD